MANELNLKPCPFCGEKNTRIRRWEVGGTTRHYEYSVICMHCGAEGPSDLNESGAVEMWNMRRVEEKAQ